MIRVRDEDSVFRRNCAEFSGNLLFCKLPIFSEIISDWSAFYEMLQARANSVNKTLFKVSIKNELQPNQTLL